jgi:hypothetical protein
VWRILGAMACLFIGVAVVGALFKQCCNYDLAKNYTRGGAAR